jgi:hypothetical protein
MGYHETLESGSCPAREALRFPSIAVRDRRDIRPSRYRRVIAIFDPNAKIDLECQLGHKVPVRLADARRGGSTDCPVCGQTIDYDGSDLDRKLRDVERRLKGFGR